MQTSTATATANGHLELRKSSFLFPVHPVAFDVTHINLKLLLIEFLHPTA
jgi:hypothetical protein